MEKIVSKIPEITTTSEEQAEQALKLILENPQFSFLTIIEKNLNQIEEADTAVEALLIAKDKIEQREQQTFTFELPDTVDGVDVEEISYKGFYKSLEKIKKYAHQIGEGGDAYMVIVPEETNDGITEVCYKFAKTEETPRGRNTMSQELNLQSRFYQIVQKDKNGKIGVPMPQYFCEIGNEKFIAMERLQARSIADLQRGLGSLPDWFDDEIIHIFCNGIEKTVEEFHKHGLYHRDLHLGNIMITQYKNREVGNKLGYIIDFGLSGFGVDGLDPYKKEVAATTFTYDDDCGKIKNLERVLKQLKQRRE